MKEMVKEFAGEIAKEESKPFVKVIRDWCRYRKYNKRIIRHEYPYITLKDDENNLMYCACCWEKDRNLIQMNKQHAGRISCPNCKQICCYDRNLYNEAMSIRKASHDSITNRRR